jgi:iron complex outermembrane recepter protein
MKQCSCMVIFTALMSSQLVQAAETKAFDSLDLSLQELMNVEVTSVSKQPQPLSQSPAAIYVITQDDIRRSGATSIPQAIRDVPGLHVAQLDSQKWAIGSRGFNGRYNNKLLVMVDGRSVYSPEFSGVYWEAQDTLMADIERIEVIRGPGTALWGANAVNGVINIITKHSADTQGGYAEVGAGDHEQGFMGIRLGGALADGSTARGYVKGFKRDSLRFERADLPAPQDQAIGDVSTDNDWQSYQTGGRLDIPLESTSSLTLFGDIYQSKLQQTLFTPTLTPPFYGTFANDAFDGSGWNLVAKYTRALSVTSQYSLQAYHDYAKREESLFGFSTHTTDVEFQYQFRPDDKQDISWGLGYRVIRDKLSAAPIIASAKADSTKTDLWSAYFRDEVMLAKDELWLTLAARLEHNDYTGLEFQPNLRLMYKPTDTHALWSSIAYSVRTPSRAEDNFSVHAVTIPPALPFVPLPTKVVVMGDSGFVSEELITYEVGYRYTPFDKFSLDASVFYNDYDRLRGHVLGNPFVDGSGGFITQPIILSNDTDGNSYGVELSAQWMAASNLKIKLNYSHLQGHFSDDLAQNGLGPEQMISLIADWAISERVEVSATWRYIDDTTSLSGLNFSSIDIDRRQGLDLGVHWHLDSSITFSLFGKNLLSGESVEYEAEQFHIPFRVEPTVYGKLALAF